MDDDKAEAALNYLTGTDESHARARAEHQALVDLKKTIKGFAFDSLPDQMKVTEKETMAYADPTYIEHIEKTKKAAEELYLLDNKRERARLTIEMWRTFSSNKRKGNI